MKPMKNKSLEMIEAIEVLFPGTKDAMANGICTLCKLPITKFDDEMSEKEYQVSGMCQECQDKVFVED